MSELEPRYFRHPVILWLHPPFHINNLLYLEQKAIHINIWCPNPNPIFDFCHVFIKICWFEVSPGKWSLMMWLAKALTRNCITWKPTCLFKIYGNELILFHCPFCGDKLRVIMHLFVCHVAIDRIRPKEAQDGHQKQEAGWPVISELSWVTTWMWWSNLDWAWKCNWPKWGQLSGRGG